MSTEEYKLVRKWREHCRGVLRNAPPPALQSLIERTDEFGAKIRDLKEGEPSEYIVPHHLLVQLIATFRMNLQIGNHESAIMAVSSGLESVRIETAVNPVDPEGDVKKWMAELLEWVQAEFANDDLEPDLQTGRALRPQYDNHDI